MSSNDTVVVGLCCLVWGSATLAATVLFIKIQYWVWGILMALVLLGIGIALLGYSIRAYEKDREHGLES